jgi:hypothetical protein
MNNLFSIIIVACFLVLNSHSATAQGLSNFKPDSKGGKQDRIDSIEKYLSKVSSSLNLINKKLKKSSGSEMRKLKKRIDKLERVKTNGGGCCKLVYKSNLPKLTGDVKANKRKVKELETKSDKFKANEIMTLQAEVQLLKASLEALKKLILKKGK